MEKLIDQGMKSFDQALFSLYHEVKITQEEAMRNADSANNLRLKIKLASEGVSAVLADYRWKRPTKSAVELNSKSSMTRSNCLRVLHSAATSQLRMTPGISESPVPQLR